MEMLPEPLLKRFLEVGRQDESNDPIILAHYFNPSGAGDWYATEFDPMIDEFFGYVSIFRDHNDEWGYFPLSELETYRGAYGNRIERDLYWKEIPFSQLKGQ